MSKPSSHPLATDDDGHDDFGGFHRDLPHLIGRRRLLMLAAGAGGAALLAACGGNEAASNTTGTASTDVSTDVSTSSTTANPVSTATAATASAGAEIPDETQGPYPADGSNGPNVLTTDGIVRSDLTTSFGDMSGQADGVPTTLTMTVVDNETGAALPGAAVYLWHCTAGGAYSIYEVADQNYLRGVQVADENGVVTFTTIFPGCYAGRWPHCHFEVYDSIDVATAGSQASKTSQLAIAKDVCEAVYADSRYGNSAGNLGRLSIETDGIFADGYAGQLATTTGSNDAGYAMSLLVRV